MVSILWCVVLSSLGEDYDATVTLQVPPSNNIFDNLPALASSCLTTATGELNLYLNTEVENVTDALLWWHQKWKTYPRLYHMALNYLSVPGR